MTIDDDAAPTVVMEVFGPERVAALRAQIETGDAVTLTAEDLSDLVATLDGLWGIQARRASSFQPLLDEMYGPCAGHWMRPSRTSGPPQFRHDLAYGHITDNEAAVLVATEGLRGTLPSFPEPPEWAAELDAALDELDSQG